MLWVIYGRYGKAAGTFSLFYSVFCNITIYRQNARLVDLRNLKYARTYTDVTIRILEYSGNKRIELMQLPPKARKTSRSIKPIIDVVQE